MNKSSQELSLRAMARELGRSPAMVLKWAESGLIPRLKNKRFNPEAVLKAAAANINGRRPLGRSVDSNNKMKLTSEQQTAEDAGVAAVMALVRSDEVCEAVGLLGRLPRQMLATFQEHDQIEYPENTLRGFERDTVDWLVRCIKAVRDE